jgi:hypothetical protein
MRPSVGVARKVTGPNGYVTGMVLRTGDRLRSRRVGAVAVFFQLLRFFLSLFFFFNFPQHIARSICIFFAGWLGLG